MHQFLWLFALSGGAFADTATNLERKLASAKAKGNVVVQARLHLELAEHHGRIFNALGKGDQSAVFSRSDLIQPIAHHFENALTLHEATGKTKTGKPQQRAFTPRDELFVLQGLPNAYYLMQKPEKALPLWNRVVRHPLCLYDAVQGSESNRPETCYTRHMNRILIAMLSQGQSKEVRSQFDAAVALRYQGKQVAPWETMFQFPMAMHPGLRAQALWKEPTKMFETARRLEANYDLIQEDLRAIPESSWQLQNDGDLVSHGSWTEFSIYDRSTWHGCRLAPNTCKTLKGLQEIDGSPPAPQASMVNQQVSFLRLDPGAQLRLHTGPHNMRIVLHLGLVVPKGAALRVANVTHRWRKGRVIAFDDSFAHEAWNEGSKSRIVLYTTIWHPDMWSSQKRKGKGSARREASEL